MSRQPKGYGAGFWVRKRPDGGGHDAARIVPAVAGLPAVQLLQQIGIGLAGDLRIAAVARAFAVRPVTGGAGDDPARRIAAQIDRWRRRGGAAPRRGHGGVIVGDRPAAVGVQRLGDPRHLIVRPEARGVILHLFLQIAGLQPGQARCGRAVALALQPVAGKAGVGRPAGAAAHGDDLAGAAEGAVRPAGRGIARRHGQERQQGGEQQGAHPLRTAGPRRRFRPPAPADAMSQPGTRPRAGDWSGQAFGGGMRNLTDIGGT